MTKEEEAELLALTRTAGEGRQKPDLEGAGGMDALRMLHAKSSAMQRRGGPVTDSWKAQQKG